MYLYFSQYNFFLHSLFSMKQNNSLGSEVKNIKHLLATRKYKSEEFYSHVASRRGPVSRSSLGIKDGRRVFSLKAGQ